MEEKKKEKEKRGEEKKVEVEHHLSPISLF